MTEPLAALLARAEAGDLDAQAEAGHRYALGLGVPHDEAGARRWLEPAAAAGSAAAQATLGRLLMRRRGDRAKALAYFREAAEQGSPDGAWALAAAYRRGAGVPRDGAEAARWAIAAAAAGHGQASMYVARLHQYGRHVPRDLDAAMRHYREAIARGALAARAGLATAGVDRALPRWKAWMVTLYTVAFGTLGALVVLPCEVGLGVGGALLGAATASTAAIVGLFGLMVRAGVGALRARG